MPDLPPTRMVSFTPRKQSVLNEQPAKTLKVCEMRLSKQPKLAGIKHLNQLERVLARNEWADPAIHEGLMLDTDNCVIEGTMSNVFIVKGGKILTPDLTSSGVDGIVRQAVLKQARKADYDISIQKISLVEVVEADEIFMTNSLMPVWFVDAVQLEDMRITKKPGFFSNWALKTISDEIERQSK
jgi:4-amino-4-deoxychorismate lyase